MTKFTQVVTLIIFCCLVLAIKARDSGKYQDDLADRNLKGKVKSCTEFFYNSYQTDNNVDSSWVYSTADTFNTKGNLTSYDISGNPLKKPTSKRIYWAYIRDNDGREIETKGISGKIISHSTYTRNAENNLVESWWSGSFSKPMLKIIYNHSGRRDTMYDYDINGEFMWKIIYRYSQTNNLLQQTEYSPIGKLKYKETYHYDEHKNKISEMHYDSLGVRQSKINYSYDDYGNMITEADSNQMYIGGNRIFDPDPNNKNILTFRCSYSNYDSHYNWLRQDIFHNGVIAKTFKRKIEYYP